MNEWSSPTSHSVSTRLRSIPLGRDGVVVGTSPLAMRSVQSEYTFNALVGPWLVRTPYIELPRTPVPSLHSHASACVFSSGFALNT